MNTPAMNTPSATTKRRRIVAAVIGITAAVSITAACSGSIVHNYRTFQSALDRGASCAELFDQRERFSDADTLAKVDADLARIGCTSPDATRTD